MDLLRKTVVITGASMGIGRAAAFAFARAGANIVVAARSVEKLEGLVSEIEGRYGVPALAVPTDVTKEEEVRALMSRAYTRFNTIDILINNAGRGMHSEIVTTPIDNVRELMDVNWWGSLYAIQAAFPYMKRQGQGLIMNVSTLAIFVLPPSMGFYVAGKAALSALSRVLRTEVEPYGILVCTVYPGYTDTEFGNNLIPVAGQSKNPMNSALVERLAYSPARVALKMVQGAQQDRVPHDLFITRREKILTLPLRLFDGIIDRTVSGMAKRMHKQLEYAGREA